MLAQLSTMVLLSLLEKGSTFMLKNLDIPASVSEGKQTSLITEYEISQHERIKKVKWLKDGQLFLRYSEAKGYKAFPVVGVQLQQPYNWSYVLLGPLKKTSSGVYAVMIELGKPHTLGIISSSRSMDVMPADSGESMKHVIESSSTIFQTNDFSSKHALDAKATMTMINNEHITAMVDKLIDNSFGPELKRIGRVIHQPDDQLETIYTEVRDVFNSNFGTHLPGW